MIVLFLAKRDAETNSIPNNHVSKLCVATGMHCNKGESFEINFTHQSQDEFLPSVELSPYANIFIKRFLSVKFMNLFQTASYMVHFKHIEQYK